MTQPESPLYKFLRKQSLAFLAAAIVASFCLILIGAFLQQGHPLWSLQLIAFGSKP